MRRSPPRDPHPSHDLTPLRPRFSQSRRLPGDQQAGIYCSTKEPLIGASIARRVLIDVLSLSARGAGRRPLVSPVRRVTSYIDVRPTRRPMQSAPTSRLCRLHCTRVTPVRRANYWCKKFSPTTYRLATIHPLQTRRTGDNSYHKARQLLKYSRQKCQSRTVPNS